MVAQTGIHGSKWKYPLWALSAVLVVVGVFAARSYWNANESTPRIAGVLWAVAYFVTGLANTVNAVSHRCIHCLIGGPAYLLACGVSVLNAVGYVSVDWNIVWMMSIFLGVVANVARFEGWEGIKSLSFVLFVGPLHFVFFYALFKLPEDYRGIAMVALLAMLAAVLHVLRRGRDGLRYCPSEFLVRASVALTVISACSLFHLSLSLTLVLALDALVVLGIAATTLYYFIASERNKARGSLAIVGMGVFVVIVWCAIVYTREGLVFRDPERPVRDLWNSLYFSTITLTSVGFGDFSPTPRVRIVAALEGLVGFVFLGMFTALLIEITKRNSDSNGHATAESAVDSGEDSRRQEPPVVKSRAETEVVDGAQQS